MKPPTMAPIYVFLYPELASIFRSHGYALTVHGTIGKDFDLVAVPWAEHVSESRDVIEEICKTFAVRLIDSPRLMNHGRECWTLALTIAGECYVDLSFTPCGRYR